MYLGSFDPLGGGSLYLEFEFFSPVYLSHANLIPRPEFRKLRRVEEKLSPSQQS